MDKTVSDYFSIAANDLPDIVDLCDLEAPEPMQIILLACAHLGPHENYLARLPHVPTLLFPQLETRGLIWQVYEETDGSAVILIRRGS